MNIISLNRREMKRLQELFELMNGPDDFGYVILTKSEENEIGSVLTATFDVTHKEIEGEFTVTISDESDW